MTSQPQASVEAPVWDRWRAYLSAAQDGASLAVFRICFGLLLAYEIDFKIRVDKVREIHEPQLNFKYFFFEWLPVPGELGVWLLHLIIIALSLLVAAGAFYRYSSTLLCVLMSYYFLLERTLYINHIYLYCLLAGILAVAPAHNMLSVDQRYGWLGCAPKARGRTPRWSIWLLRFQMGAVYSFAGLAKLNPDWLAGSPMNMWLPSRLGQDHWLLFDQLPLLMSWGGAAFDLSVTPLLLFKRTRTIGFLLAAAFHLTNANIFGIASFPWMSLALTAMFFDPDWPRRQWPSLKKKPKKKRSPAPLTRPGFALLMSYVATQVLLPMRPWFYPGNPSWTEEGHEFSWHMMLRSKDGNPTFEARFADGRKLQINPLVTITKRQLSRMRGRPDLIHQFALFVADDYQRRTGQRPQVFVNAEISLNGRPPVHLIDPNIDLAAQPRTIWHSEWIMPAPKTPAWTGKGPRSMSDSDE